MLEEDDIRWAKGRLSGMVNSVHIRLTYSLENEFYLDLLSIMERICSISEKVELAREQMEGKEIPAMLHLDNIHYQAIPDGKEFRPFIETIFLMSKRMEKFSSELEKELMGIKGPITIRVAISPFCNYCPQVVQKVNRFAVLNRNIEVFIIDCLTFEGERKRLGVRSTPSLIINEKIVFCGSVGEADLLQILRDENSRKTIELILISQIRNGDIEGAINTSIQNPDISSEILAKIMGGDRFEMRMGVMLVLEELAKKDRHILSGAIPILRGLLNNPHPQIRGDASYILGKTGRKDIIDDLKRLLDDPDPDVVDCAREAIDELS
jgi:hypothetical protein